MGEGGESHLSASAGFRAPPKASFPRLGGWVLFIPLAHDEMSEHMLTVRWGPMKVKNGMAALIPSQHQ